MSCERVSSVPLLTLPYYPSPGRWAVFSNVRSTVPVMRSNPSSSSQRQHKTHYSAAPGDRFALSFYPDFW